LTTALAANSDRGVNPIAHEGEWQLGTESGLPVLPPAEVAPPPNLSAERLGRPLHTLTVEDAGWLVVAAYALISRLTMLAARPLDASEAVRALAALGHTDGGITSPVNVAPQPGWVRILTAVVFAVVDPSDWSARIVPAICGLLLIALAFALRRYIGRAAGLALALFLTLSPAFTYFARSDAPSMPAAMITLAALYAFLALVAYPGQARAACLGIAAGLMAAVEPDGLATAGIFLLALSLIGLYRLIVTPHAVLNMRVWFDRYRTLVAIVLLTAIAVWVISKVLDSDFAGDGGSSLIGGPSLAAGLRFYWPAIALNEFLIVIGAIIGLAAVASFRMPSALSAWALLWTLISLAFWLWAPVPNRSHLPSILLPMALIGAIGVEWLHHTTAWPVLRAILGTLALLTLYVQVLSNFVHCAPDASEAGWDRHVNLDWGDLTTTVQTRFYASRAMEGIVPEDATVYFYADSPALRWYLRDLRPVADPAAATVIVGAATAKAGSNENPKRQVFRFAYAETWPLDSSKLSPAKALRFIFTGSAWADPVASEVTITAPSASSFSSELAPPAD